MKNSTWVLVIMSICAATYHLTGDPMTQAVMGVGAMVFGAAFFIVYELEKRP